MQIEKTDLYKAASGLAPTIVTINFVGYRAFGEITPRKASHALARKIPPDMAAAVGKAHQELLNRYDALMSRHLVPAVEAAAEIIRMTKELTDGQLQAVTFGDNLSAQFIVGKASAKPLAALYEFCYPELVEDVRLRIDESGVAGANFAGLVRNLSYEPERTAPTTLENFRNWVLADPNHVTIRNVTLNELVDVVAERAAAIYANSSKKPANKPG